MAVAKRQGREKPVKIEQRKVWGLEWEPQVEQTALLASPIYIGQAQGEGKKKNIYKVEPKDWGFLARLCTFSLSLSLSPYPPCLALSLSLLFSSFGSATKESTCSVADLSSIPGLGRSSGERRERLPTPVFWPREFHGLFMTLFKSQTQLSDFHFQFSVACIEDVFSKLNWAVKMEP